MKKLIRLLGLGLLAAGFSLGSAFAGSQTFSSAGQCGSSGSFSETFVITTPATTSVSSSGSISGWSGGGGVNVYHSQVGTVLDYWLAVINRPSWSASTSNQPAGTYTITHGVNGPPNTVSYNFSTTVSW